MSAQDNNEQILAWKARQCPLTPKVSDVVAEVSVERRRFEGSASQLKVLTTVCFVVSHRCRVGIS